jgi:serine/threonine protein kinase
VSVVLQSGDMIEDKYRVLQPIGEGGSGIVFLGEDVHASRQVAIKVLNISFTSDKGAVEHFEHEARAASRVSSEHVVDVLDVGDLPTGERYMVMEYLEGQSLSARLEERRTLPPREAGLVAVQLLEGLGKVHDVGIIHRDLKPESIFLTNEPGGERVKILDFGICRIHKGMAASTAPGIMFGTPQHMSPEQATDGEIDARSDLYSMGVVLYRCVTGTFPYDGTGYAKVIEQLLSEAPRPIDQVAPNLDPDFAKIIMKAMARAPEDRYQSAASFATALNECQARIDRLRAQFLAAKYAVHPTSDSMRRAEMHREPTESKPSHSAASADEQTTVDPRPSGSDEKTEQNATSAPTTVVESATELMPPPAPLSGKTTEVDRPTEGSARVLYAHRPELTNPLDQTEVDHAPPVSKRALQLLAASALVDQTERMEKPAPATRPANVPEGAAPVAARPFAQRLLLAWPLSRKQARVALLAAGSLAFVGLILAGILLLSSKAALPPAASAATPESDSAPLSVPPALAITAPTTTAADPPPAHSAHVRAPARAPHKSAPPKPKAAAK